MIRQVRSLRWPRFRREAEAAANLRSPHTVELYDFGVTDDQTLYFVMELLEGMDLESLVRQHGPVPRPGWSTSCARRAPRSRRRTCAAWCIVTSSRRTSIWGRLGLVYDFVKVLDFGLVKPIAERSGEQSLATQAGLIIGTPGYMAPEMALSDQVDGRADIYALGCVAYYLLTGQQVFDGDTPMQVLSKHLQAAPVPPSKRVPAGHLTRSRSARPRMPREKPGGQAAERRRSSPGCSPRSISNPGPMPRPGTGG